MSQTYGALVSAFSPYDEFALYTYSSTVTQVTDFAWGRAEKLTATLDQMKRWCAGAPTGRRFWEVALVAGTTHGERDSRG